MKRLLLALALLFPAAAEAQQYPNHSMMIGSGPGTTGFKVLGPCATGQVPTWTGGPTADPVCSSPPGTGTVLSVGVGLPVSTFVVVGSPVTGSGTITGSFINQNANFGFFGPTSGVAATPSWRALVGADLPLPTTSTLGGIQAINAVTSQWIRSINGSGVPTLSQPTFSDIAGVATGSQLPFPSLSTLGGVLSNNAITSNWVNSISTGGLPILSQPTFNDIAGSLGVGQISTLIPFSVIANATSSTASPTNIGISPLLDATFSNVQGSLLYRSSTTWTSIGPGTSGQVLQTQGAAANPTWATVSGVGTVTSVTCGTGLSGGTFTASGTCALASVADGTVLSNISGASSPSSANTLTTVIDHDIGNVQGDIAYRGGSVWSALAPGTAGQFLQSGGPAANPSWAFPRALTCAYVTATNASWNISAQLGFIPHELHFEVWGGGASGAAQNGGANTDRGAGGGAGGFAQFDYTGTMDTTLNVTVGAGGASCTSACGGNGGGNTTVVGTNLGTITAGGGSGPGCSGPNCPGGGGGSGSVPATGTGYIIGGGGGGISLGLVNQFGVGGNAPRGGQGGAVNVASAGGTPGGAGAGENHTGGGSGAGARGQVNVCGR